MINAASHIKPKSDWLGFLILVLAWTISAALITGLAALIAGLLGTIHIVEAYK